MATVIMFDLLSQTHSKILQSMSITPDVLHVLLIFGEITPKTIAIKNASNSHKMTPFHYYTSYSIPSFFSVISVLILDLGIGKKTWSTLTEEEIKTVIKLGEEEGVLERQEKEMIHGVLNISEKVVREIMTPRIDHMYTINSHQRSHQGHHHKRPSNSTL